MSKKGLIHINSRSNQPKYQQIIDSITWSIEKRNLIKGDKLPSINEIANNFDVSRDTVMCAFNKLKAKGIIISQPGKGYYIVSTRIHVEKKIFLLFDEFNTFKEDLYLAFSDAIKKKALVDIYFYHFNFKVFNSLITESNGSYTTYVIMPGIFENSSKVIDKLPKDRVFILDRLKKDLVKYPVIYQDFENDFYDALLEGKELLKKYRKLIFIHPGGKEPQERVKGFKRFCEEYHFNYEIIKKIGDYRPCLYEAFFVTSDRELVKLLKIVDLYSFKLGKDFGIVSFNDTVLKEVTAGGITTISTDFKRMGKKLARMILKDKKIHFRNSSQLIIRKSL